MSDQPKIEIYGTEFCNYCAAARLLLKKKRLEYTDILVSGDEDLRSEMARRSGGRRTVPQIFINDAPIGGFDELNALEKSGELDTMTQAPQPEAPI
jgi:glutaredoxin 3